MALFPIAKLKSLRWFLLVGISVMTTIYLIFMYIILSPKPRFLLARHFDYNASSRIPEIWKLDLQYVVVHFDLKGAPPNLNFLGSLLPMIKKRGANAILMEYEDMFPYEGSLVNLSSPNCYTRTELKQFLEGARNLNMEVIPLIQTFGHLEFVLKLPEYIHLRENPEYPESICPTKKDSHFLIKNMVEQIITFHNGVEPLKHIHIGNDEVYNMNQCPDCQIRKLSLTGILLEHISRVVGYVKEISPETTVLGWDDMISKIKPQMWSNLEVSLKNRLEPVHWQYSPDPKISHITLRQHHIHFGNIWVATAFKGADGIVSTFPNIRDRFANHYLWLRMMHHYKFGGLFSPKDMIHFKGIILTGWSRYQHFEPLCDLLPLSLPSLFMNLVVVKKFQDGFPDDALLDDDWTKMFYTHFYEDIKHDLQCPFMLKDADFSVCNFATVRLYKVVQRFMKCLQDILSRVYVYEDSVIPVLNYYLQNNNIQKRTLEREFVHCKGMELKLNNLKEEINHYLARFYNRDVIDEFTNSKSYEITEQLTGLVRKMQTILGSKKINFSNKTVVKKSRNITPDIAERA